MTDEEKFLKKYKSVPFDILTIVDGMRVLKRTLNGKAHIYVYPQELYERNNAEEATK
tara:strand:- start:209 stop:379 length:171 start_codon:yes stop_codon:yes gene_type:complete